MKAWLTLTEYAAARGINRRTAQSWARDGRIRAKRTAGGHWRVDPREAERRLLTPPQVAAALGVNERTVRSWAASGRLAARRARDGGTWLVEPAEVERLMAVEYDDGSRPSYYDDGTVDGRTRSGGSRAPAAPAAPNRESRGVPDLGARGGGAGHLQKTKRKKPAAKKRSRASAKSTPTPAADLHDGDQQDTTKRRR